MTKEFDTFCEQVISEVDGPWKKHDGKGLPKGVKKDDLVGYMVRDSKEEGASWAKDLEWNWKRDKEKGVNIIKYRILGDA